MGYHVRIINTAKDTAASAKMLNRPQDWPHGCGKNFDFYADTDDSGQQYFYRADDQRTYFCFTKCVMKETENYWPSVRMIRCWL